MKFDALSSELLFFIVVIGRFTFERSLIIKFEMLAILKFDCSKFQPSPKFCNIDTHNKINTLCGYFYHTVW